MAAAVTAAVSRAMGNGKKTSAGKAARRKRQRARRRNRMREGYRLAKEVFPEQGLGWMGPQASGQAVPSENYEPMMPAIDSRVIPEVGALGATPSGGAWALKALHPNGARVTSAAGIPDHTHVPVVTPEFRVNHILTGITRQKDDPENDDVDIVFMGTPDLAFVYRRYPAGKQHEANDKWVAVYWSSSGAVTYEKAYLIKSVEPGSKPEIVNARVKGGNIGLDSPRARGTYAGLTVLHDAPALNDQGRVVAGQLPVASDPRTGDFEIMTSANPPGFPEVTGDYVDLGVLPLSEDELFQATPGAYVNEAREGVYVPLRFNRPIHDFVTLSPAKDQPPVLCYTRVGDSDTKMLTVRNRDLLTNWACEGTLNFLGAVVLFRGVASTANFSLKARLGLEMQVERGSSTVAPFQHQSPPLDRMAIDMVTRVAQESPQAFPACYNDNDDLMGQIRMVLGMIKKSATLLGGLGVPYAGLVGTGLETLGFAPGRAARGPRVSRAMRQRMLQRL